MKVWKCPVCGKAFENFGFKEFAQCPKTTLFGDFTIRNMNGEIQTVNRRINKPVCSEECKQLNENRYLVEEYKGSKIFCVNGRYMNYLEAEYYYDTIEGTRHRIDNPHLVPATETLMRGLGAALSGEPANIL